MQDMYAYHCGGFGQEIGGDTGADSENSERGGQDTCQLYGYYYFTENSLKIIEKITEKGVATWPPWSYP